MTTPATDDEAIAEFVGGFADDPYGFVLACYPWGEPGTPLEHETGPDDWQRDELIAIGNDVKARGFNGRDPVDPIRAAVASGHGIGKSAMVAWITDWIMSTRPNCKGTITAGTAPQLETKTWPELAKWTKLCLTSHWFTITMGRGSMKMVHNDNPDGWRVTAQTSREENSESFAGQHAADSTSFYIFDEGSIVPATIWEVAEGGLTDGEPMFFAFGNPTRNSGKFHELFHKLRHRWRTRHVDARTAKKPNKALHQQWIDDHGIDSDFVKVRILGQFPNLGDMQWIPMDRVTAAQRREVVEEREQRMIISVDVARGGDNNVIARRRGRDARSWPWVRFKSKDTMLIVGKVVDVYNEHMRIGDQPVVMVDETGLGGPVIDRLRQLGIPVIGVQFAGASTTPSCANHRTEIWDRMRNWLVGGCIPDDQSLYTDLTVIEYGYDKHNKWLLQPKETMDVSPDDADALAIGFSVPVPPKDLTQRAKVHQSGRDYDLFR